MSKKNCNLKILKVYSHTHAITQCKKNILKNKLNPINYMDTAGAAKFVKENKKKDISAIASQLASKIYGLKILIKRILKIKKKTLPDFLFLLKIVVLDVKKKIITSIVFNTKNVPASLYNALGGFAKNGINLTRLESFFC